MQVTWGENKNTYKILVGKPQGKTLFGRPKRRWEENIKTDHIKIKCTMNSGYGQMACLSNYLTFQASLCTMELVRKSCKVGEIQK
jgi:hypothetical protein